jgi:hypothetical protein
MNPADPLAGLPPLPAEQDLPAPERTRAMVLAGVRPGRTLRVPYPARRLVYPLAAAAAVAAIVTVLAVVLPGLAGPSHGNPPAARPGASPISPGTHISTYAGPVGALVISDGNGTVTVTGSQRSSVQVTTTITDPVRRGAVASKLSHGTLQLTYSAPDCGSGRRNCARVNYAVQVPSSLPVQVVTDAGDVSLRGVSSTVHVVDQAGDVDLSQISGPAATVYASAGSVALAGVSSAQLTVHDAAGDVHGTGLASPATTMGADAGDLSLQYSSVPEMVSLTDSAGGISLQLPPGGTAYRVSVHADAGSATVRVPQDPSASRIITARADAGDITIST